MAFAMTMAQVAQDFTTPIAMKLDEDNFLRWKYQVESMIEGYELLDHITEDAIPEKHLSNEDEAANMVNPEYEIWKKQDVLLKTWLLGSMNKRLTMRMVGCVFSHLIWSRLETYYSKDHIEAILNGLLEEYTSFITTITTISKPVTVGSLKLYSWITRNCWKNTRNQIILCKCTGHKLKHLIITIAEVFMKAEASFVVEEVQGLEEVVGANLSYSSALLANEAEFVTPSTLQYPNWYPDSEASHHMTANALNLIDKTEYAGLERVTIRNGLGLPISHVRNSIFILDLNKKEFLLKRLLLVPQISKNLLSVYQFVKDNQVFFEIYDDHCVVKYKVFKEVILQRTVDKGLCKFSRFHPKQHSVAAFLAHVQEINISCCGMLALEILQLKRLIKF
ncbi:hypothetical protein AHAS_Ahas04G0166800 [Arachis hypogaea]